jgi:hypothetical protein
MNRHEKLLLVSLLPLLLVFQQRAEAQLNVKQSVFGNGGGTTADNQFRIAFTAGQPAIGVMNGPSNIQRSGFWYVQAIFIPTNVEEIPEGLPTEYRIEQNYPNPFNPETQIRIQLPEASHVVVKIYSILGREIATLADGHHDPGYYTLRWDGTDNNGNPTSTGVYFYRIQAGKFSEVRKMVLLQ